MKKSSINETIINLRMRDWTSHKVWLCTIPTYQKQIEALEKSKEAHTQNSNNTNFLFIHTYMG